MRCSYCLEQLGGNEKTCPCCAQPVDSKESTKRKTRKDYLAIAFETVDKQIDKMFEMKDEKVKVLFFSKYKYSVVELQHSPEYSRIEALIGKIHDDVTNWDRAHKLSVYTRKVYNRNRELLIARIDNLQEQIRTREKTLWEKIKAFFKIFADFILSHIPEIWNGLMLAANKNREEPGILGGLSRFLLMLNGKIAKYFPISEKDEYISQAEGA